MTVEIGIIVSLVGCIIAIVSFIIGQKKSGKDDGLELGNFMGMIKTEIANIKEMITELKNDHREVDTKIRDAIQQHEDTYHKK
jgi:hypothetical protein